ncbi:MAG: ABC transporter permease, partial [Saprospiraceae bacterium]|nr:ABC transporter permease [Saprospiraceae bacterium]
LFNYIRYEQQYDRNTPHASQIWRVFNKTMDGESVITQDANTHSAVGPVLKAEVPGVADYFRLYNGGSNETVVIAHNQPFDLERFFCTDPGFFRMIPQHALFGNLNTSLDAPYSAVLTEQTANKLFGAANAVGQTFRIPSGMCAGAYTVAAVVANPPQNSHLKFDLLTSYATRYAKGHEDNFDSYWDYSYFMMEPGSNMEGVRKKLASINEQFLKKDGIQLDIQPFTDIHLKSELTYEIESNGSARMVQFLGLIALFVLCIALINYLNLTTALAGERAKEIAIRKTIGAGRGNLIRQFFTESLLVCLISFLGAAFLTSQTLPWFGDLIGRPLAAPGAPFDWHFWQLGLAGALVVAFLAGIYPAFKLSGLKLSAAFAGAHGAGGAGLRKGLVVTQFMLSVGLIFGVIVVQSQLSFLKNHELGIQLDQMVSIKAAGFENDSLTRNKLNVFKDACSQLSGIGTLSASSIAPGLGINGISGSNRPLRWTQKPDYARITSYFVETDEQFFDLFGVKILAGTYRFSNDRVAQYSNVAINRAMLDALGFPNPEAAIGQTIGYENSENGAVSTITAVIDNFHIESLKTTPKPTLYYCFAPEQLKYLSFKVSPANLERTLNGLQQIWQKVYPEHPFRYWLLDEHFAQQYRSERQFSRVFGLFAVFSIVVSCLGLLGLTAYSMQRRRKEIGIRKVLGATTGNVAALLTNDFLRLVALAVICAAPFAYYAMNYWLENFAHRVSIQWWMFVLAGTMVVMIALATVLFQSLKAALTNPVECLKQE